MNRVGEFEKVSFEQFYCSFAHKLRNPFHIICKKEEAFKRFF